jgi:acyl-CoA reductase-like NAD-dependent aldehyde dehydrogenase
VALAERLGPVAPLPPEDPKSPLAAFTVPGVAESISNEIEAHLAEAGAEDVTAKHRGGEARLVKRERCDYLRPTVIHCDSPSRWLANKEYMFPFVSVVACPQDEMIASIGPTLVGTAITSDARFRRGLLDAVHIDRLNLGPVPTIRLNWLQPHEGSIIDFLFRARAYQEA